MKLRMEYALFCCLFETTSFYFIKLKKYLFSQNFIFDVLSVFSPCMTYKVNYN